MGGEVIMDFNKIVNDAVVEANKAVIENQAVYTSSLMQTQESREIYELYAPIIKYVNALVAESLRLYHLENNSK